jgi:hypothetical protein
VQKRSRRTSDAGAGEAAGQQPAQHDDAAAPPADEHLDDIAAATAAAAAVVAEAEAGETPFVAAAAAAAAAAGAGAEAEGAEAAAGDEQQAAAGGIGRRGFQQQLSQRSSRGRKAPSKLQATDSVASKQGKAEGKRAAAPKFKPFKEAEQAQQFALGVWSGFDEQDWGDGRPGDLGKGRWLTSGGVQTLLQQWLGDTGKVSTALPCMCRGSFNVWLPPQELQMLLC